MRFIHTADWQIGMKAVHVGQAGNRVREERLRAAKRVIHEAEDHAVDFIVLAGDLFEDNGVDRILVQRTADILGSFNGGVYLVPGNHDPYVPGSVWEHPSWEDHMNIHVMTEEKPIPVPEGTIYPCPVRERRSDKNPTAWIERPQKEGIKIGVAHGTVEGIHREEPDYPIPRQIPVNLGLDYMALGHWHSMTFYRSADDTVRMAYSGTHEPTGFGERDSGHILLVHIDGPGRPPEVTAITTGGLQWLAVSRDIRHEEDLKRVREELERIEDPSTTLVDIKITGVIDGSEYDQLRRIEEIISARFLFSRININDVIPRPKDDIWISGLPAGVVREAARRLREMSDPGYPGNRPAGGTPETAGLALMELYAMIHSQKSE